MISMRSHFSGKRSILSTCKWGSVCAFILLSCWSARGEDFTSETQDVEITANTEWPQGNHHIKSLTIRNGAVLGVAGGSTVTLTASLTLQESATLILRGVNNTAQVDGVWKGAGVAVIAGDVSVSPESSIIADGQGYQVVTGWNGMGPGGGASGSWNGGGGGGYGGAGGNGAGGGGAAYGYDQIVWPTELGSSGGRSDSGSLMGHGGGAIQLFVTGTLNLGGVISANGLTGDGDFGGGAGGSILVDTNVLTGEGYFQANGGNAAAGSGAGGGGRIAVYYTTGDAFDGYSRTTASGGLSGGPGQVGTAAFIRKNGAERHLRVSQSMYYPEGTLLAYESVTVDDGGALILDGGSTISVTTLNVLSSSTLILGGANNTAQVDGVWKGMGVAVLADNVNISSGSLVTADGQGYQVLENGWNGMGPGGGASGSWNGGGGGGYGGAGGNGAGAGGAAYDYDKIVWPTALGSAGGRSDQGTSRGHGGGAIQFYIQNTLTLHGVISANGLTGDGEFGGGAGGSILVETVVLTGTGYFQANGGNADSGTGAGGGGRIAIHYTTGDAFSGYNHTTASGGISGGPGQVGTAAFIRKNGAERHLRILQSMYYPEGTLLNYDTLTLENGAALTVDGGSTITVTDLTLHSSSTLSLWGANNSALVDGVWKGVGVAVFAENVTLDSGSRVTADGQGYQVLENGWNGTGPGGGATGSWNGGGGGGYGGAGGNGAGAGGAAYDYDKIVWPMALGSSGGRSDQGTSRGHGGGAIQFYIQNTLTLNGVISANGLTGDGEFGGGAGGSILLETAVLTGAGYFQANGGNADAGAGGGGGGRIAIHYTTGDSFGGYSFSTASGGSGANSGQVGTTAFIRKNGSERHLRILQSMYYPEGTLLEYDTLTLENGAVLTVDGGSTISVTNLTLQSSSTLYLKGANIDGRVGGTTGTWEGKGVAILADNLRVETGSVINADGQGYTAGSFRDGNGPGGGKSGAWYPSGGGAHGGAGGSANGAGGNIYDDPIWPTQPGSAGGTSDNGTFYGHGGGAIQIHVKNQFYLDGRVTASGLFGDSDFAGGAGGSILVETHELVGSGLFRADGGACLNNSSGGGGGGRIALYYEEAANFTGFRNTSATGGSGAQAGQPGTIALIWREGAKRHLTVYQNLVFYPDSTVSYDSINVDQGTFAVGSKSSITATTFTATNNSVLSIGGGSTVQVDTLSLLTTSTLWTLGTDNTGLVDNVWAGKGGTFTVGDLTVDATSRITADGQGYTAGYFRDGNGPGGGRNGGWYGSGGGGHGGVGGNANSAGGPSYDSPTWPVELGSAGGSSDQGDLMGHGGGAIQLFVEGTFTLEGVISANGSDSIWDYGGGSGGSIAVKTNVLAGTGFFRANGGTCLFNNSGGGGGGRIAVYYNAGSGFTGWKTSTANSGTGSQMGGRGTTLFVDTHNGEKHLKIYEYVYFPEDTVLDYNTLTLSRNALLEVDGGSQITVQDLIVTDNSVLRLEGKNLDGRVDGEWKGTGVVVTADNVTVTSGSVITSDGQGYTAGNFRDGNGPGGSRNGGWYGSGGAGHGGAGGNANSAGGSAYDSPTWPLEPGSAGGSSDNGSMYGHGGGAIQLFVNNTLLLDGVVTANGTDSNGDYGGGAGGSIAVRTNVLAGTGLFQTDGGTCVDNGSGGGAGGRIAVYYESSPGFEGFLGSSAHAGTGSQPGEEGTIAFVQVWQNQQYLQVYHNLWFPEDSDLVYDGVVLDNQAKLTLYGGSSLTVWGDLDVLTSSTIVLPSKNRNGRVEGEWKGIGSTLSAGNLKLDASSRIDADYQGYIAGSFRDGYGPGGGKNGGWYNSGGGGYGGAGGSGNGAGGIAYGSDEFPVDLGSAGGTSDNGSNYGHGGGAIRINVDNTFTQEGLVSAIGHNGDADFGGGAGGSILINTYRLMGDGLFRADGGPTDGYSGGGGGGRIAVYCSNNQFALGQFSAKGGEAGDRDGQDGTIRFVDHPVCNWISPAHGQLHGASAWIEWDVLGVGLYSGGELRAYVDGVEHFLGAGLGARQGVTWDTTQVPDGMCELRLAFRDTDHNLIGEFSTSVLINNSVMWHSGTLETTTTWKADIVHIVEKDLIVAGGITLFIEPGSIVKFVRNTGITVQDGGTLSAPATLQEPIILTSISDDTAGGDSNLDGDLTRPRPGEWRGLTTEGTGQLLLSEYVEVRYAVTHHSGTLTSNEIWNGTFLHIVPSDLTIPAGLKLTILPGAVVKLGSKVGITVSSGAEISAIGSFAQPVVFTSLVDDSVGGDSNSDADKTQPAAGDWRWIYVDGVAHFEHARIYYGGGTASGNWDQTGVIRTAGGNTSTTLNACVVENAFFDGVLAWGGPVSITNSVFKNIDRAISAHPGSPVRVVNCTLDRNRIALLIHGGTLEAVNNSVSNSLNAGIQFDFGQVLSVRSNNTWNPLAAGGNCDYVNLTNYTGQNGNTAVDPLYKDPDRGNYRLSYRSPLIDAAEGVSASQKDFTGSPRYDDPRTANTGSSTANGALADLGAFEFVETAESDIDLVVDSVAGPLNVEAGTQVAVTWTIQNVGSANALGPWHDAISLVSDSAQAAGTELGTVEVLVTTSTLAPGQSITFTKVLRVPGGVEGVYRWQVRTNARGEVFEGRNSANNTSLSSMPSTLSVPELIVGTPVTSSFPAPSDAVWYKVRQDVSTQIEVVLDASSIEGQTNLYAGFDSMPSAQSCDQSSRDWNSPDARLALPSPDAPRTVYLLVQPDRLSPGALEYSIQARVSSFAIEDIGVRRGGNLGQLTLPVYGSGFLQGLSASLKNSEDGTEVVAQKVEPLDSTTILASFDLRGVALGVYDVVVTQNGESRSLASAFTVQQGGGGLLSARLVTPQTARPGRAFYGIIEYANVGDADLPVPLLILSSDSGDPLWPEGTEPGTETELQFLGGNPGEISTGVLRPGEQRRVGFNVLPSSSGDSSLLLSSKEGDSQEPFDWEVYFQAVRPDDSHPLWQDAVTALETKYPATTYGEFLQVLGDAADEMARYHVGSAVVANIVQYMIMREEAFLPGAKVEGKLYLGDKTHPLSRVLMTLEDTATSKTSLTRTWYDGSFSFRDVPAGHYALSVQDYFTGDQASLDVTTDGTIQGLEIILTARGRVSGRVLNAWDAEPVGSALVTVRNLLSEEVQSVESDAEGYFEVTDMEPGMLRVQATAVGFVSPVVKSVDLPSQGATSVLFEMTPGGSIQGLVLSPDGKPVAKAVVMARLHGQSGDSNGGQSAETDESGRYEVTGLAPGTYTLTVTASGFGAGTLEGITMTAGGYLSGVVLHLTQGGGVLGTVRDAKTNLPIANATILTDAKGRYTQRIFTDAAGVFHFPDLLAGEQNIWVKADQYLTNSFPITVPEGSDATLDATLRPAGRISGVVQLQGSAPVAGVAVTLSPIGTVGVHYRFGQTMATQGNGDYLFQNLPDGSYAISVGDAGGNTLARQVLTLDTANNEHSVDLVLAAGTITGTVEDGNGSVAGKSVSLFQAGQLVESTVSDASGVYRFLVFQSGPFEVGVATPEMGVALQSNLTATIGVETQAPPLKAGTAPLSVTVTDSTNGPVPEASVSVRPAAIPDSQGLAIGSQTDAGGVVSFSSLVPGDYVVSVTFRGLAREVRTVSVTDSGAALDIQMKAARTVSGWVRDEGNAMLFAYVSAVETSTRESHIALVDPSTGRYTLDTLADGTYDLWVADAEHCPAFFNGVAVSSAAPTRILNATLLTTATTLTGRVTDPLGAPVVSAQVALTGASGIPLLNTVTENDGTYQLGPLPQGEWEITVAVPGFLPVRHTVTLPGIGLVQEDFQLGPLMAIAISARTAISTPFSAIEGFSVTALEPALKTASAVVALNDAVALHSDINLASFTSDGVTGSEAQAALAARWGADTLGVQPPEWPYSDNWLLSYTRIKITRWCQAWSDAYDEAIKSERAVRKAFEDWQYAYGALDDLSAADMSLTLAESALWGAKTLKTLSSILQPKRDDFVDAKTDIANRVGAPAADALLFGVDRMVDLAGLIGKAWIAGDFNAAETLCDQFIKAEAFLHDWVFKHGAGLGNGYLGKIYGVYAIGRDFLKLRDEMNKRVNNDLPAALSVYSQAQEQFLAWAKRHHANMRAVQAGADYCQDGKGNKPKRPLPKPPKPKPEDKKKIPKKGSYDPNEKDTVGFGPGGFVQPSETLIFTVHFENMTTASAKAQQVTVADQLDANLDWSSFEVMQVAFANTSVAVPAGLRSYQTQTTVANDPNPVRVNVALDTFSGVVNWTIRSVDPVTGGIPEDPLAGFLPPNDITHVGEGYVTYKVSSKAGLPDGTVIQNQASIVFDVNAPIVTNVTVNTLDGQAPQSAVDALPETTDAHFLVTWSGVDNAGGSGVASYDLYVKKDNEAVYQLWLGATTETQAVYLGEPNHSYSFYTIARDWVGNVEPIPAQPDTVTEVHEWLPPTGVAASDGQFLRTIQVTWNSIPQTYYRVFRSTSPAEEPLALSDWITTTTFTDQPPEALVTYFYSVQVARDAQGATASDFSEADAGWAAAPDDSPLNLAWKVTYRNCTVVADAKGSLTITESSDRSSVKINAVRPGQKVVARPGILTINCGVVPNVTIDGPIGVFYTDAPVKTLTATGGIKSLFAKGCAVQDVTAGSLGQVRMDALVDSSGSGRLENTFLTATTTTSAPRPASVQLTGVLLQNLMAPSQKIQSVKVGTKKYVNRTTGVTSLSYGEIPGGTIRALELGRVSVQGGVFRPETVMAGASASPARFTVQGGAFVIGSKGALQPVFRSGALSPGVMDVQAPVSLSVTGGDSKPVLVISTGQVALFSAKSARFRGSSGVQYIGGKLGLEAADLETTRTRAAWEAAVEVYLLPELRAVLQTQSSVILSGAGTASKQKDIRSVFGDTGVTGIFISGATKQPDNTWLPNFGASVISIGAGKAKSGAGTPEIRGESWSAKPIKWARNSAHTGFKERVSADLP